MAYCEDLATQTTQPKPLFSQLENGQFFPDEADIDAVITTIFDKNNDEMVEKHEDESGKGDDNANETDDRSQASQARKQDKGYTATQFFKGLEEEGRKITQQVSTYYQHQMSHEHRSYKC